MSDENEHKEISVRNDSLALESMDTQDMIRQINQIQAMMGSIMKEGEHYGTIPGCGPKKTLLKPGAEKLCFAFRLAPTFRVISTNLPGGHREYEVICTLTQIHTGRIFAEGVGTCSSMESKYRFRKSEGEIVKDGTGVKRVPQKYWEKKDKALIGGEGFGTKKVEISGRDTWVVVSYKRVEHDNPADNFNTCLKIGKKRAFVDATITATAASDIFTQDIEDLVDTDAPKGKDTREEPKRPTEADSQQETSATAENIRDIRESHLPEPMIREIRTRLADYSISNDGNCIFMNEQSGGKVFWCRDKKQWEQLETYCEFEEEVFIHCKTTSKPNVYQLLSAIKVAKDKGNFIPDQNPDPQPESTDLQP